MSPVLSPTRRTVLAALAGAAGACLLPSFGRPSGVERFVAGLLDLVAVPDPFAIGASYLRGHRDDHDADRLLVDVFAEPAESGSQDLFEELRARFRDDFRQERTVAVDGWLLSRTEARLCALLTLDR